MNPRYYFLLLCLLSSYTLLYLPTLSADDSGSPDVPKRTDVHGRIIDITHRYEPDLPAWDSKDGTGQVVKLVESLKNGSLANVSEFKLGSHSGTHVDAPSHFYEEYYDAGFDTNSLDLETLNGPALLVDVPRDTKYITADVMKDLNIPKEVHRVLFRTSNTDRNLMGKKEFDPTYVGFMEDGAKWLVENTDIKLVGLDYLSVSAYVDAKPTHLVFLKSREIILLEAVKLDNIEPGLYNLHCLPIRLVGSDGAPTRCILII